MPPPLKPAAMLTGSIAIGVPRAPTSSQRRRVRQSRAGALRSSRRWAGAHLVTRRQTRWRGLLARRTQVGVRSLRAREAGECLAGLRRPALELWGVAAAVFRRALAGVAATDLAVSVPATLSVGGAARQRLAPTLRQPRVCLLGLLVEDVRELPEVWRVEDVAQVEEGARRHGHGGVRTFRQRGGEARAAAARRRAHEAGERGVGWPGPAAVGGLVERAGCRAALAHGA
mmetsp:Transcript_22279/g.65682  ORF Transcript_22279/g.65682 Transcript_22279/m.65682 type:complete len:229 (-) Transcript_22279:219-905(-)